MRAQAGAARRPVYVRGVGAVTPFGASWSASLPSLRAGLSAVAGVRVFDATGFPCTVAAPLDRHGDEPEDRRLGAARPAANEAWREAELAVDRRRLGVFIGAESGRATLRTVLSLAAAAGGGRSFDYARFGRQARALAGQLGAETISPASVASALAGELGAGGPVETVSLACASGSAAIAEGARAIRAGECDAALCGGVGTDVDPLMMAGFGLLGALSARGVSRPFDAHRDGFVVGEGAAMVVLSCQRGPERRGAAVALAGIGRTLDAHHLTAPDPEGAGALGAMSAALRDAGVDSVQYVQAHGTSTPLNDAVEATALRRLLGAQLDGARVSSIKGALGHWIAGAGALGLLCAVEAVRSGTVLPTAGLTRPDPACELPHVLERAVDADVRAALCNAFAFGGANCSLVVQRCS